MFILHGIFFIFLIYLAYNIPYLFRSVLSWNVNSFEDINEESLSLFPTLEPKIDVLIIGIGDQSPPPSLSKRIVEFMKKYKINVEVLRTEQV